MTIGSSEYPVEKNQSPLIFEDSIKLTLVKVDVCPIKTKAQTYLNIPNKKHCS